MMKQIPFLDLQGINARYMSAFSNALQETLEKGWFLHGAATKAFEQHFAAFCGASYCVGVANGLDALTLILKAKKNLAQWEDYDEVLVPAHTFVASAQAVLNARLKPVLVDVDLDNALIDMAAISQAIGTRTKAIMVVHLYGMVANARLLRQVAKENALFLVEDAAQAHGATDAQTTDRAGNIGDAAAFSFYPGKNLGALGDGGAVVTNDRALADAVRTIANYGAAQKYRHTHQGCNSRLDELQAAFLDIKLRDLDADNRRRKEIARHYLSSIKHHRITLPYQQDANAVAASVFHLFPILAEKREELQIHLANNGIQTLIHYPIPIHRQPCFQKCFAPDCSYPNAEHWASHELSLPISPMMTDEEVESMLRALNEW